jgi:hypothetical protein
LRWDDSDDDDDDDDDDNDDHDVNDDNDDDSYNIMMMIEETKRDNLLQSEIKKLETETIR